MKNVKGVTLVALIITIIVMFIIFGITATVGVDVLRNSQKNRLKTNLYLIQSRAATLLEDYLFDDTNDNLGAEDSSSLASTVGFDEKEESGKTYKYRVWNADFLESQGISTEDVVDGEQFVIQYNLTDDIVDVASTKGYKDSDGNSYYILSDL